MFLVMRTGRPRGLRLSAEALEHLRQLHPDYPSKAAYARAVGISAGFYGDVLYKNKGVTDAVAQRMADALDCDVRVIAPTLTGRFVDAAA